MNANEILMSVYNESQPGTFPQPQTLTHFVGGNWGSNLDELAAVKADGLQVRQGWADINAMLPQRPLGVFFWGEEMAAHGSELYRVQVSVSDLDTSKLFAFPNALAEAANGAKCGRELIDGCLEAMAQAQPVAYADYDGSFAAEWIYTDAVPAFIIK